MTSGRARRGVRPLPRRAQRPHRGARRRRDDRRLPRHLRQPGARAHQRDARSTRSSTTGCWTSSPPSATAGPFEAYREVVETGAPWQMEVEFDGLVGGARLSGVFEMRAVKLGDGILVTYRDMTDLRRAEAAAELMAAIVESTDDAIVGADREGRITHWNAGAERLLGYARAEIVGPVRAHAGARRGLREPERALQPRPRRRARRAHRDAVGAQGRRPARRRPHRVAAARPRRRGRRRLRGRPRHHGPQARRGRAAPLARRARALRRHRRARPARAAHGHHPAHRAARARRRLPARRDRHPPARGRRARLPARRRPARPRARRTRRAARASPSTCAA